MTAAEQSKIAAIQDAQTKIAAIERLAKEARDALAAAGIYVHASDTMSNAFSGLTGHAAMVTGALKGTEKTVRFEARFNAGDFDS